MNFLDRLIEIMQKMNMKQNTLAKELSITQPTLNSILKGKSKPSLDTVINLCKFCEKNNISTVWLLTGNTNKNNNNSNYSIEEQNLIQAFREVSPEIQKVVINTLEISRPNMDKSNCTRTG